MVCRLVGLGAVVAAVAVSDDVEIVASVPDEVRPTSNSTRIRTLRLSEGQYT